ncbi:MAG: signal peptidase I [Ktedonobacteraceae bacterium]|nr:signal peptidase I [Ktedonobacteraceae bacterium]
MKRSSLTREIVELVMIALLLFGFVRFVWHGYHMQGSNMQPGIPSGAYVMVNKASYLFSSPAREDIIVFHYPFNTRQDVMARVIGLPGDTIRTDSSHVWVNGGLLQEPYVRTPFNPVSHEWKVSSNTYFVLNDNRQISDDSRNWDTLPRDFIIGKAVLIYWPVSDWQML